MTRSASMIAAAFALALVLAASIFVLCLLSNLTANGVTL